MAKSKNHTAHNQVSVIGTPCSLVLPAMVFPKIIFQTRKNHRGGIKKPSTRRHMSMKGGSTNLNFVPPPLCPSSSRFLLF